MAIRSKGRSWRPSLSGITTAALVVAALSGTAVFADSDGYFCTGEGYLAYETRWSSDRQGHVFQIVRFGEEIGIVEVKPIRLEDFQTHDMSCGSDLIHLQGASVSYRVDITQIDDPKIAAGDRSYPVPSEGHRGNLGHWAKEAVLDLTADGRAGRFQLVIARVSQPVEGGIEHHTMTELIERDARQAILRSLRLFSGIFLETVH